ncbi:MAG: hypothetical protein WCI73_17955, partial [Phycisphaerae bacterium]
MKRMMVWCWWVFILTLAGVSWAQDNTTPFVRSSTTASRTIQPGTWTIFDFTTLNPTSQPLEAQAATFFDADPNIQFRTQVWLPPHTERKMWQPVRLEALPTVLKKDGLPESVSFQVILLDATSLPERQWKRTPGNLLPGRGSITALIGDRNRDETIDEVIMALRKGHDPPLPPGVTGM